MTNYSKNFSYDEMTGSATARRLGIDNTPTAAVSKELKKLCATVLQPIRDAWGKPIIVSSGYRCPKLNKAVGGATTSQHQLGQAADMHAADRSENAALYRLIEKMVKTKKIDCGQIIWEYGTKKNPQWIHISLPGSHHNQFLTIGVK